MLIKNERNDKICFVKTNEYTSEQTVFAEHEDVRSVMILEKGASFLENCDYEAKKNFKFFKDIDTNDEDCYFEIIFSNDSFEKKVHKLKRGTYVCFREKNHLYIEQEY